MSEDTQTPPLEIVGQASHNNVSVDLVWQNPRRVPKGEVAVPYVAPNFDALTDAQLIELFGAKEVRKRLISAGLTRCKGFFGEACSGPDENPTWDGEKSLEEYQKMFADWSARGETLAELRNSLVEIAEKMVQLVEQGNLAEAQELVKEAQQLKKDIVAKKRKPKNETVEA